MATAPTPTAAAAVPAQGGAQKKTFPPGFVIRRRVSTESENFRIWLRALKTTFAIARKQGFTFDAEWPRYGFPVEETDMSITRAIQIKFGSTPEQALAYAREYFNPSFDPDKLTKVELKTQYDNYSVIFARGMRFVRPWDRPQVIKRLQTVGRVLSEEKTDIKHEHLIVGFWLQEEKGEGKQVKLHNTNLLRLVATHGKEAYYQSMIVSTKPVLPRTIRALVLEHGQSIRVSMFTLDDLAFDVTGHCLNLQPPHLPLPHRLNAREITDLGEDGKRLPKMKEGNIYCKMAGLRHDDVVLIYTMDPVESSSTSGLLMVPERTLEYRIV